MHWNGNGHMGWMGFWWIVGAVLIGLVIWALLRASRRPMDGSSESPERVLKHRYADGEMDRETYERMLEDLRK